MTDATLLIDAVKRKAGIGNKIVEMTMVDYHAAPGISKSRLDHLHRSPAHYKYALENPSKPTQPMIEGSVFHKLVLEPDTFTEEYAVIPDGIDRRYKEGKEVWAAFEEEAAGKICIDRPTLTQLTEQAAALRACTRANALLSGGKAEQSLFWTIDGYDVPIPAKARIDYANEVCLVDLKTTKDARPDSFSRDCWNYRYHVQAAYYSDAYKLLTGLDMRFVLLAVEKTPPYGVAVYMVNEDMISQGRREYQADLEVYARCAAADVWPGYEDVVQEILLPRWAREDDGNGN